MGARQLHAPGIPRLVLDVETFSTLDLPKVGAHAYAEHPDTDVHCVAFKITGSAAQLWHPGFDPCPPEITAHVANGYPIIAHNWLFELNIWQEILVVRYGWPAPAWNAWSCTMARALYHGFPAGLEALGEALGLAQLKQAGTRALMLQMSKPRNLDKLGRPVWWHNDPKTGWDKRVALAAYCLQDVEAEFEADQHLPELPKFEREVFRLDGEINQRGVAIDLELVDRLDQIAYDEGIRLNRYVAQVTGGAVRTTSQVAAITQWLAEHQVVVQSLDKAAVALALQVARGAARNVLLARAEAAKSSTAKLTAMRRAVSRDGRARGLFQYGGAGRTMRWAGRRVQPQNMPRPHIKDPERVAALIDGVMAGDDQEVIRLFWPGSPMDNVACALRGCMVAGPGQVLIAMDEAQIEARVIAWLAGQQDILDVFARGDDVYTYTARSVGSPDRQFGKVLVLACGYGLGPARFVETAASYGITLDLPAAQAAVWAWRAENREIVAYWYRLGEVFLRVAQAPHGTAERLGHVVVRKTGKAVRIVLPTGHEMFYQDVQIHADDQGRPEITYLGVNQLTRRWERLRTWGGKLCLGADTLVLTDRGWVPIVSVRQNDLVWDGTAWVQHQGVVFNGMATTVTLDGIAMTAEHEVATTKGWVRAADCEGLDRRPVALPDRSPTHRHGAGQKAAMGNPLRLRGTAPDGVYGFSQRHAEILRLPERPAGFRRPAHARHEPASSLRGVALNARPMPVALAPCLEELRWSRDHGLPGVGFLRGVLGRHGSDLSEGPFPGAPGQQRRLCTGELRLGLPNRTGQQPQAQCCDRHAGRPDDRGAGCASIRHRVYDAALSRRPQVRPVFDLLDTGPHHQFVVLGASGPLIVHNCENVTQAFARDVLADCMLRLARPAFQLVGSVHDEVLIECDPLAIGAQLDTVRKVMAAPIPWARGLPLAAEGWAGHRYRKG